VSRVPVLCQSCQAPIFWAVTEATGTSMPIDEEPTEVGNVTLLQPDDPRDPPVAKVHGTPPVTWPRYMPHHATCPQALQWKRS
jgi:hypothetical protein